MGSMGSPSKVYVGVGHDGEDAPRRARTRAALARGAHEVRTRRGRRRSRAHLVGHAHFSASRAVAEHTCVHGQKRALGGPQLRRDVRDARRGGRLTHAKPTWRTATRRRALRLREVHHPGRRAPARTAQARVGVPQKKRRASPRRSRRPSRRTSDAREAHAAHRHPSAGAAAVGGAPPRQAPTRAHSPGARGCAPEEEATRRVTPMRRVGTRCFRTGRVAWSNECGGRTRCLAPPPPHARCCSRCAFCRRAVSPPANSSVDATVIVGSSDRVERRVDASMLRYRGVPTRSPATSLASPARRSALAERACKTSPALGPP